MENAGLKNILECVQKEGIVQNPGETEFQFRKRAFVELFPRREHFTLLAFEALFGAEAGKFDEHEAHELKNTITVLTGCGQRTPTTDELRAYVAGFSFDPILVRRKMGEMRTAIGA